MDQFFSKLPGVVLVLVTGVTVSVACALPWVNALACRWLARYVSSSHSYLVVRVVTERFSIFLFVSVAVARCFTTHICRFTSVPSCACHSGFLLAQGGLPFTCL